MLYITSLPLTKVLFGASRQGKRLLIQPLQRLQRRSAHYFGLL